jgi:hypothetical protein
MGEYRQRRVHLARGVPQLAGAIPWLVDGDTVNLSWARFGQR